MPEYFVDIEVDFLDAAERTSTRDYRLAQTFDTALNNWDDVLTAAGNAITALNVLTMAAIPEYRLAMVVDGSGTANVASNNQVVAFSRTLTDPGGYKGSIEVPSWDDVTFDENNQNILSDAYDTAVAALMLLLIDPTTNEGFAVGPEYSQSRTRKSRNIIHD